MRKQIKSRSQRDYWDAIAENYAKITVINRNDFHYGPQIPGENVLKLLTFIKPGMKALELGCGGAQNSIWLAKRGLLCDAVDISANQIKYAGRLAEEAGAELKLWVSGIDEALAAANPDTYDFIHSSHAMEFVENPEKTLYSAARALKSGGRIMISSVHPLFNGNWVSVEYDDENGRSASMDGQLITNYFEPEDDIRDDINGHVISRAYPISAWFKWFKSAGLKITDIEEPAAIKNAPYTSADWANHEGQLDAIPSTIIFVAEKPL